MVQNNNIVDISYSKVHLIDDQMFSKNFIEYRIIISK